MFFGKNWYDRMGWVGGGVCWGWFVLYMCWGWVVIGGLLFVGVLDECGWSLLGGELESELWWNWFCVWCVWWLFWFCVGM